MKGTRSLPLLATLLTLQTTGLAVTTSSSSAPQGSNKVDITAGYTAASVAHLNPVVFATRVGNPNGVSGSTLTIAGTGSALTGLLNVSKAYYLEAVTEGLNATGFVGERFEVDVAATLAANGSQIVLSTSSPTNTRATVPDLSDYSIVVREHVTLSQVFGGLGRVLLKGSGSASTADQVSFFDNATNSFQTYWLRANAGNTVVQWRSLSASDATDYSNLPIRPGVGVFIYRQPSAGPTSLRLEGLVRMNAFKMPLPAGFSLISPPQPIPFSPALGDMLKTNGWTGSGSASTADQVNLWTGTGFDSYWFNANVSGSIQKWLSTNAANTTDSMNDATFFKAGQAIMVQKQSADTTYTVDLTK